MIAGLDRVLDGWASAAPRRRGYGYHENQPPWRYDPAVEQSRGAFLEFLALVGSRCPGARVVQLGMGRHGGSHFGLRMVAHRVCTVTEDAQAVRRYVEDEAGAIDGERDAFVVGHPNAPETRAEAASVLGSCEVLFADPGPCYEDVVAALGWWADLVRPGGIVAFVDGTYAFSGLHPERGADAAARDLERDWLRPRGTRLELLRGRKAIRYYRQTERTAGEPVAFGGDLGRRRRAVRVADYRGFGVWRFGQRWLAVPSHHERFDPYRIARADYEVVLAASTPEELEDVTRRYAAARAATPAALRALGEGNLAEARALVSAAMRAAAGEDLAARLAPSVACWPHSKELLQVLGTWCVLQNRPRQGAAILRRALEQDVFDQDLLRAVAKTCLDVLGDEDAARSVLDDVRRRVRRVEVAELCRELPRDRVLWNYPTVATELSGVVLVGGEPRDLDACRRLRVPVWSAPAGVAAVDDWAAARHVDLEAVNLLWVRADGGELDVLRGARGVLDAVDHVVAQVCFDPARRLPRPEQVADFLREYEGAGEDLGFRLRACEREADLRAGEALFTRARRRRFV